MNTEPTSPGAVLTAPRPRSAPRREAKTNSPTHESSAKESPAAEILHEIFRSQGMDLRESNRTRALVSDLFAAIAKGGK